MSITNGYCTLIDVRNLKRITIMDATDDDVIEDLIEAASRYIDGFCGRRFHTTTNDETRTYSGTSDGERCYTDDIISITTLKTDEDGDRTYENTWAVTDYDLCPNNAALDGSPYTWLEVTPNGNYGFPDHRKGVQIVGKFGFASAPHDIRMACLSIVSSLYYNRFGQSTQGAATVTGAGVVITPEDIPASAVEMLKKWRRLV